MNTLTKNLFKTFITSIVVSIAVNCIYYAYSQRGTHYDYAQVANLIVSGALLLNVILFIMSASSLFLANTTLWNNISTRLILYFAGPIVFIATTFFLKLRPGDGIFYFSTGTIFLLIHAVFYVKLVKKSK
ncbi:hypothetical protein [Mucilaginibacter sp.]|uniref:hypothetical protein n=1 Tax=Mucilaginibacter sp. TaxID=1882438 RepID=UPI003D1434E8